MAPEQDQLAASLDDRSTSVSVMVQVDFQAIAIENEQKSREKIESYTYQQLVSTMTFMIIATPVFYFSAYTSFAWYIRIIGPIIRLLSWLVMVVCMWKVVKARKELRHLPDTSISMYCDPVFYLGVLGLCLFLVVLDFIVVL